MSNGEIAPPIGENTEDSFQRTRRLGERGAWMVMHPHTCEHMDVVDFDIEIARRKEAGLQGHNFFSAELPEEVDK